MPSLRFLSYFISFGNCPIISFACLSLESLAKPVNGHPTGLNSTSFQWAVCRAETCGTRARLQPRLEAQWAEPGLLPARLEGIAAGPQFPPQQNN